MAKKSIALFVLIFVLSCSLITVFIVLNENYLYLSSTEDQLSNDIQLDNDKSKTSAERRPHLQSLNCTKYGGPNNTEEATAEMVYWWKIPQDEKFVNSFQRMHANEDEEKFFIFEPDGAGWNNVRMSLETILIMGISMGRTIVLPPANRIYLFNKRAAEHKYRFTFRDFFRLEDAEIEHYHIKFISMDEYLEKVAMKGLLFDQSRITSSREALFPPDNRTDWNQANDNVKKKLWEYIRKTSYQDKICKPVEKFISYFPDNTTDLGPESQKSFMSLIQNLKTEKFNRNMYNGNPPPVNASEIDRLREHYFKREKVCFYNNQMQKARTLHYKFEWNGVRFLLPFYTFHYFQNWKQELWTKRFIRDHIRYNDEIMCAAARIVAIIRKDAKAHSPENKDGLFNTMHIRRGDFKKQYKQTLLSAEDTYEKSKKYLQNHTSNMLYIATDEKNSTFFKPLQTAYNVVFLSNYSHLIQDINPNYHPLIEQLVLARGDVFVGTMYSTFTSYINRLRGYYSWRDKLPDYDKGAIQSYYFTHAAKKYQQYFSIHDPMWAFEFAEAWYDIDHDVEN